MNKNVLLRLKNILKIKNIIIYIIALTLFYGILISVIYNLYSIEKDLDESIENNINNKVLYASKNTNKEIEDSEIERIKNIENISKIYKRIELTRCKIDNLNYSINYVDNKEINNIEFGKIFENKGYEIIIPNKMVDSNEKVIYNQEKNNNNVELLIGRTIINCKIVGIYQNDKYENIVYINENIKDYLLENNIVKINNNNIYIIIDRYSNIEKVKSEMNNHGFNAELVDESGISEIKIFKTCKAIFSLMVAIMMIFSIFTLNLIINQILEQEKSDMAIMKSVGYKNKDISKIIKYRIWIILIIAIVLGTATSIVINSFINYIEHHFANVSIQFNIIRYLGIVSIIFILVYTILNICLIFNRRKIKKINIIEILKE